MAGSPHQACYNLTGVWNPLGTVIEGSWDQLAARADELRKHRRLKLIVPDSEGESKCPNQGMLDALTRIAERQKDRAESTAEHTDRLIRDARSGQMYGIDGSE